jgi:hypothetical protein
MWDENAKSCDCKKIQEGMYAHSNVTGQCLLAGPYCSGNAWDDEKQVCKCEGKEASSISGTCITPKMIRDVYTSNKPCADNEVGSYCFNPCKKCNVESTDSTTISENGCTCNCSDQESDYLHGPNCNVICKKAGGDRPEAPIPCCLSYCSLVFACDSEDEKLKKYRELCEKSSMDVKQAVAACEGIMKKKPELNKCVNLPDGFDPLSLLKQ